VSEIDNKKQPTFQIRLCGHHQSGGDNAKPALPTTTCVGAPARRPAPAGRTQRPRASAQER
jgi:hypothetical protein